jgi:hypothetical protein
MVGTAQGEYDSDYRDTLFIDNRECRPRWPPRVH